MAEADFATRHLAGPGRQRGGTVIGMLVGIVLGLAIAVVVAAFVSKAPVPFVDKLARSGDTLPLDPPAKGAPMPDPNQSLYSRTDAMPGAVEPPRSPSSDPIGSLLATLGQLGRGSSDDAQPATGSAASGGAPIEQRTQPPSGGDRVASLDPQAGYVLQAGAYRAQPDADSMRARLALMGFEARVLPTQVNGETLYRVRLGPYAGLDEMNRARARLSANGVEASVVRQR